MYNEIERYMCSLQAGRLTFDEYFPDDMMEKEIKDYEEPVDFIAGKAILEFSTHVRKYSGIKRTTCDNYKSSRKIIAEKCDDEEIAEMLQDLNVFGEKKDTPEKIRITRKRFKKREERKPEKKVEKKVEKRSDDLMPLLLDESFFKLENRKSVSNTDNSSYDINTKKEYTPREIYNMNRRK